MKLNNRGFTLVEILIALAISAVVLTAIYQTYHAQQKSYIVQEEVAKMQQNLRAAIIMMAGELRMAGYDPSGSSGAGIVAMTNSSPTVPAADTIRFTRDLNGDGTINTTAGNNPEGEDLTYRLVTDTDGIRKLLRVDPARPTPAGQPIAALAENIDALDFVGLTSNGTPTTAINEIRTIQIALVARSNRSEQNYVNNFSYPNLQGNSVFNPGGDGVRRIMLNTNVKCRNLRD